MRQTDRQKERGMGWVDVCVCVCVCVCVFVCQQHEILKSCQKNPHRPAVEHSRNKKVSMPCAYNHPTTCAVCAVQSSDSYSRTHWTATECCRSHQRVCSRPQWTEPSEQARSSRSLRRRAAQAVCQPRKRRHKQNNKYLRFFFCSCF